MLFSAQRFVDYDSCFKIIRYVYKTDNIKQTNKKECHINSHKFVADLETNVSITNKVVDVKGNVT